MKFEFTILDKSGQMLGDNLGVKFLWLVCCALIPRYSGRMYSKLLVRVRLWGDSNVEQNEWRAGLTTARVMCQVSPVVIRAAGCVVG